MTWIISKKFTFEAAHKLPQHDGKCRRLHGHSWVAIVYLQSSQLIESGAKQGMVMDYSDLKKAISPILENYLDHHYLNESLDLENPTCENVAQWLYSVLVTQLPSLCAIEIRETCTTGCLYTGTGNGTFSLSDALTLGRSDG